MISAFGAAAALPVLALLVWGWKVMSKSWPGRGWLLLAVLAGGHAGGDGDPCRGARRVLAAQCRSRRPASAPSCWPGLSAPAGFPRRCWRRSRRRWRCWPRPTASASPAATSAPWASARDRCSGASAAAPAGSAGDERAAVRPLCPRFHRRRLAAAGHARQGRRRRRRGQGHAGEPRRRRSGRRHRRAEAAAGHARGARSPRKARGGCRSRPRSRACCRRSIFSIRRFRPRAATR